MEAAWLPDGELIKAAASGDRFALQQLVNWNWAPLLSANPANDNASANSEGRSGSCDPLDGCGKEKSGEAIAGYEGLSAEDIAGTGLAEFISHKVARPSFWQYWVENSSTKGCGLDIWLRRQLEQSAPHVMLRTVIRKQLRQKTMTCQNAVALQADTKSATPEMSAARVEAALEIWREIIAHAESHKNRKRTGPLRRVLEILRRDFNHRNPFLGFPEVSGINVRKLSTDAYVVELVIEFARNVLAQRKQSREFQWNLTRPDVLNADLEDWLRTFSLCIRYGWVDWKTGEPSFEFKRASSLNLLESSSQVMHRRDVDDRVLNDLFDEPLRNCLPQDFQASIHEASLLKLRIRDAIVHPEISCDLICQLKSWSKRYFELGNSRPDCAYLVLYYACIVAAFIFHNCWISSQNKEAFRQRLADLIESRMFDSLPWLRDLCDQCCTGLNQTAESE